MSRRIALAVNPRSDETEKTIQWSLDNFLRPEDHIHVVVILVMDAEFNDIDPAMSITESLLDDIKKKKTEETMKEMQILADGLTAKGYTVTNDLLTASASDACRVLVEHIEQAKMDCLVMGRRELSGWKRFFLGSFSDRVQSSVHCPVLIVR